MAPPGPVPGPHMPTATAVPLAFATAPPGPGPHVPRATAVPLARTRPRAEEEVQVKLRRELARLLEGKQSISAEQSQSVYELLQWDGWKDDAEKKKVMFGWNEEQIKAGSRERC